VTSILAIESSLVPLSAINRSGDTMIILRRIATLLLLACGITSAAAEERAIIVLDASGSMWGQIDGRAKIAIARDVLADVLGKVPSDVSLGLLAYGQSRCR
jgi:hypothetical protein